LVISIQADSLMACCVQNASPDARHVHASNPIVAVPFGTTNTATLPRGATIEIRHNARTTLVEVKWQQRDFLVHFADLLDACRVEDLGEITWPDALGYSAGEAE
jgi:hypothetical protein